MSPRKNSRQDAAAWLALVAFYLLVAAIILIPIAWEVWTKIAIIRALRHP